MKKSLIALAVLAASGAAMAQSSVTLFGIVDAAVTRVSGSGAGHRVGLSSGSNSASRLGFRGTEDLGGGLAASFWLEGALNVDNGTAQGLSFQRRSTVSLSGNFGEVRLGRDYSPTFWNSTNFDPFGTRGVGQALTYDNFGFGTVRNSNSIGYFLPSNLGGFYGQAQYAFGEQLSTVANDKAGNFLGGRIGFQNGPINVAASYGQWKQAIGASNVAPVVLGRDLKVANIGASYDFGVVKPMVFAGQERVDNGAAGNNRLNSLLIGATAPLGAGELRASVARYDLKDSANDFNKFAIGYGYNLSKRTQVYTTLARVNNKGASARSVAADGLTATGVAPGRNSNGFDIGVRHSF
ncbi:porin [uncultured Xylophilus sp.]|uniref:porin n=1 Tax=uncultured Xylophilus sp. TaxID=296832 RepID=UPI0025CDFAAF|nr:porin [uncultured Xylophilus sp.]